MFYAFMYTLVVNCVVNHWGPPPPIDLPAWLVICVRARSDFSPVKAISIKNCLGDIVKGAIHQGLDKDIICHGLIKP